MEASHINVSLTYLCDFDIAELDKGYKYIHPQA